MRLLLLALAVVACHRSAPEPATPANKAAAPDYRATADDVLGFLPADSEVVIGIDLVAARSSALWHQFAAQIDALAKEGLSEVGAICGADPLKTVERITFGFKLSRTEQVEGVFVIRGIDPTKALDCAVKHAEKEGRAPKVDRGVLTEVAPKRGNLRAATTIVGSTLVMQIGPVASYDTMQKVLASGAPLRKSSPIFMQLFDRREHGAALWGMANGNAPMFDELAQTGMRPKSIDGTLRVTDRFVVAARATMGSPGDATRLSGELDQVKGPASAMLERFDTRVTESTVGIDVSITEPQLRALIGTLGGAMGP
jgi:hypothetical protein